MVARRMFYASYFEHIPRSFTFAVGKQLAQQPWMEFLLDVAFLQHRTVQLPLWLWRLSDIVGSMQHISRLECYQYI